jgi:hypothetical protein
MEHSGFFRLKFGKGRKAKSQSHDGGHLSGASPPGKSDSMSKRVFLAGLCNEQVVYLDQGRGPPMSVLGEKEKGGRHTLRLHTSLQARS